MMNLSDEEISLIQSHRERKEKREAALTFRSKAIETAYLFDKWSIDTGENLTFSTFINDFNYQERKEKLMYEAVRRIFSTFDE